MGQDILWHDVKWKKLVDYGSPGARLKAVNRGLWSPWRWLRKFSISKEWRPLLESFNGLMYFNDALERNALPVRDRLDRDFPVLADIGLLWNREKSCPKIPSDLPVDEGGHMMASLSPDRVVRILQDLKQIDHEALRLLIQEAVDSDAVDKIFESGAEFVSFIEAITIGFEKAVSSRRGLIVLLSY